MSEYPTTRYLLDEASFDLGFHVVPRRRNKKGGADFRAYLGSWLPMYLPFYLLM